MKTIASFLVLLFALVAGCSDLSEKPASKTKINFRIDATGRIWVQERELQLPARHAALEAVLGTPSRTRNYTLFEVPFTNYVWDDLGIMTVNSAVGKMVKINIMLFGDLPNPDISPKSRFNGLIQLPSGVLVFDDYVETEGLGFQMFMNDANVLEQDFGGIELLIAGKEISRGRPTFAHIAFDEGRE